MPDLLVQTLLCIPVLILNGYLAIRIRDGFNRVQERRFLKHVRIKYPDSVITFSAMEATDHEAMKKLKAQLDVQ